MTASTLDAVAKVLDLPFRRGSAEAVLGLDHGGDHVDLDYAGFGWTMLPEVTLEDSTASWIATDALVVAVHSADDGAALPDDVELEFALGQGADGAPMGSAIVPLSLFLRQWLPQLPDGAVIVLAMCNPHRAQVVLPAEAGERPLYYAVGEVDSWLDQDAEGERIRLVAPLWRRAKPRTQS
jgi:hypothetical protein